MTKAEIIAELTKDRAQTERVFTRVNQVVSASFQHDIVLRPVTTLDEVRRRTVITTDWFIMLKAELGYSTEKALDFLPKALRATLDGVAWSPPPAEKAWAPSGG